MKLFENLQLWWYGKSTWEMLSAHFMTIDNKIHYTGNHWKWIRTDKLLRSGGDYIMCHIKSDGYIKDEKSIMYPLENILSIEWQTKNRKTVVAKHSQYKLWCSDEEIEKLEEVVLNDRESGVWMV